MAQPPQQPQQGSAYNPSYQTGMPPQEYQQIASFFQQVDADRSGQISAQELHRALSLGGNNFSIDVVTRLMMIFDQDRSGQIGLNEFVSLHKYLQAMRESFQFFDRDRSGSLDTNELHQALVRAGYQVSINAVYASMPRFDKQRKGSLSFDQYLDFCIYLSNLRKVMQYYDPQMRGSITLTFDQLVGCTPFFT